MLIFRAFFVFEEYAVALDFLHLIDVWCCAVGFVAEILNWLARSHRNLLCLAFQQQNMP